MRNCKLFLMSAPFLLFLCFAGRAQDSIIAFRSGQVLQTKLETPVSTGWTDSHRPKILIFSVQGSGELVRAKIVRIWRSKKLFRKSGIRLEFLDMTTYAGGNRHVVPVRMRLLKAGGMRV